MFLLMLSVVHQARIISVPLTGGVRCCPCAPLWLPQGSVTMGCCAAGAHGGPYQADGRNSAELAKKSVAQEDVRNAIHDDEEGIAEEVKDHMPEPALPTLLESAFQLARVHDNDFDTVSSESSRPTTVLSIPTPSIQASNFDSLANSSIRAEFDKESARYSFSAPSEQLQGAPSVGAPSECGTRDEFPGVTWMSQSHSVGAPSVCGTIDCHSESFARVPSGCANYSSQSIGVPSICSNFDAESLVGSIAESRLDSQAYLQDLEAARVLERKANREAEAERMKEGPPLDGSSHHDAILCGTSTASHEGSPSATSFERSPSTNSHDLSVRFNDTPQKKICQI